MKLIKNIFTAFIFLLATHAIAEPVMGTDYKLIEPAKPTHSGNKIEVLEFFFYGCSHCFHLHPDLTAWERKIPKDVELILIPTIFNPAWEPMAYTYYALEVLGQNHNLHHDLYDAWNVNSIDLGDENKISAFVSKHGVDSKKFSAAYHSFGVQSKVTRSKQLTQSYNIRGTPTLIVDGKYLITGLQPAAAINVLNALVEKARKERGTKQPNANQGAVQTQKVSEAETPADCLKLAAAIKACDQTGGLMTAGCKAVAKSQYTCQIPIEQLMR